MAVEAGMGELAVVVRALSAGPARVLGIEPYAHDVVLVDPTADWTVTPTALVSKSKNTPLLGRRLRGRVIAVALDGEVRYRDGDALAERTHGRTPARA
jgi:dihydroorotase